MKTVIYSFTHARMYTVLALSLAIASMMVGNLGCDLIDPTEVRNPQITQESIVGQPGSMRAALQGLRTAFSNVVENTAYFSDVVSDNYDNIATFISPNADFPSAMRSDDLTLNGVGGMYFENQEMRALATFAIDVVAPADPGTGAGVISDMVAEAHLLRGLSLLILAENFSYAPVAVDGPALPASQLLTMAVADLTDALGVTPQSAGNLTVRTAAQYALARTYRLQGNKASAGTAATAALALSTDFVFLATFDAQSNTNAAWTFAVVRNLNDIQPLPRLDFLDPKYTNSTGISPIPVLKTEEIYLIQAEIAISDNDLATARDRMKDAIALATGTSNGRATVLFTDNDPRLDGGRPNADTMTVKANSAAPEQAGLVFARDGATVTIKEISNTSVVDADVDALVTVEDHHRMLYLLRQEIFFLEGRRMSDLGIRLPIMKREEETNPTINDGDPATLVVVPNYIPTSDGLDAFTIAAPVVTITNDMNLVIATNKVSPFTIP